MLGSPNAVRLFGVRERLPLTGAVFPFTAGHHPPADSYPFPGVFPAVCCRFIVGDPMTQRSGASSGEEGVFHVFHSNSLEDLAQLTFCLMRQEGNLPPGIFDPVNIIVPNAGMENWLNIQLAGKDRLSVSMRNIYHRPWSFAWKLFASLGMIEENRPQERYRRETMILTIYAILDDMRRSGDPREQTVFDAIMKYVTLPDPVLRSEGMPGAGDPGAGGGFFSWEQGGAAPASLAGGGDLRLFQFSAAIAEIFDRYIIYRSDWLRDLAASRTDYLRDQELYGDLPGDLPGAPVPDDLLPRDGEKPGQLRILDRLWRGITPEEFRALSPADRQLVRNSLWQPVLWRKIVERNSAGGGTLMSGDILPEGHIASMTDLFARRMEDPSFREQLPPVLYVFGLSTLEPLFFRLLKIMSRRTRVFYLHFNPCSTYWCDFGAPEPDADGDLWRRLREGVFREHLTREQLAPRGTLQGESRQTPVTGALTEDTRIHDRRCRLLASWGRAGGDCLYQLVLNATDETEVFVDPRDLSRLSSRATSRSSTSGSVLGLLQGAVFRDQEPLPFDMMLSLELLRGSGEPSGAGRAPDPASGPSPWGDLDELLDSCTWEKLEHNLEIHSAYSPMREVEAVYDRILHLFDEDPTLKPSEIVVMAPAISSYAPYIAGVFGRHDAGEDRSVPYVISDQSYEETSAFLRSFFDLLKLPRLFIDGPLVLSLLDVPQILARFGLNDQDRHQIREWIDSAVIRGDWSEDALEPEGGEPVAVYSVWQRALERMTLGAMMTGGQRWQEDLQPFEGIRDQADRRCLASLGLLVRRLVELRADLTALLSPASSAPSDLSSSASGSASQPSSRSPSSSPSSSSYREPAGQTAMAWQDFVRRRILEAFYQNDEESAPDVMRLTEMLRDLVTRFDSIGPDQRISLDVFAGYLRTLDQGSFRPFMSGRVNFCTFVPMRAVPFRRIFMIGMNSRDFPRQDEAFDFDLMRRSGTAARRGDRSRRDDDRYMFLETLISARDGVWISYVGRSPVNNSAMNPSSLVTELLEFLGDTLVTQEIRDRVRGILTDLKHSLDLNPGDAEARLHAAGALDDLRKKNAARLLDPGAEMLVFQDTLHLWDRRNFQDPEEVCSVSDPTDAAHDPAAAERMRLARQRQSYQSMWLPSGGTPEQRMRRIFLSSVRKALSLEDVTVLFPRSGEEASDLAKRECAFLRRILDALSWAPLALYDHDGRRPAVHMGLTAGEIRDLTSSGAVPGAVSGAESGSAAGTTAGAGADAVSSSGSDPGTAGEWTAFVASYRAFMEEIRRRARICVSTSQARRAAGAEVLDKLPDLLHRACVLSARGRGRSPGILLLGHEAPATIALTDAGEREMAAAGAWRRASPDPAPGENKVGAGSTGAIGAGSATSPDPRRTLTVTLEDLAGLMIDPLDALLKRRFGLPSEEDERYLSATPEREELEPGSRPDLDEQAEILDFCGKLAGTPSFRQALAEDPEQKLTWLNMIERQEVKDLVAEYALKLEYSGRAPRGRAFCMKTGGDPQDPRGFLMKDIHSWLKRGIEQQMVLIWEGLAKLQPVTDISVSFDFAPDELMEPYRSAAGNQSFRVTVKADPRMRLYQSPDDPWRFELLFFNSIRSEEKDLRRFLLQVLLLASSPDHRGKFRARFFSRDGGTSPEYTLAPAGDDPREEDLLRELCLCYLRAMACPLAFTGVNDSEKFNSAVYGPGGGKKDRPFLLKLGVDIIPAAVPGQPWNIMSQERPWVPQAFLDMTINPKSDQEAGGRGGEYFRKQLASRDIFVGGSGQAPGDFVRDLAGKIRDLKDASASLPGKNEQGVEQVSVRQLLRLGEAPEVVADVFMNSFVLNVWPQMLLDWLTTGKQIGSKDKGEDTVKNNRPREKAADAVKKTDSGGKTGSGRKKGTQDKAADTDKKTRAGRSPAKRGEAE